jgi:hypothetical protein
MNKLIIFLYSLASYVNASAQEIRMPTDNEIKTSYCIPVIQKNISQMAELKKLSDDGSDADATLLNDAERSNNPQLDLIRKNYLQRQEIKGERGKVLEIEMQKLNKLQSYIVPLLNYMDINALMLARERAEMDLLESANSSVLCSNKCGISVVFNIRIFDENIKKFNTCMDNCGDSQIKKRLNSCRNPNWLPY